MEWSAVEVDRMLNESPWVALEPLGIRPPNRGKAHDSPYPFNLRVLLLSAQPVRDAYLRRVSFAEDVQTKSHTVDTAVLMEETKPQSDLERIRTRLQRFAEMNPGDIRVRGSCDSIVIAISMTQYIPTDTQVRAREDDAMHDQFRRSVWWEEPLPDFLMELQLSDWKGKTFLSTSGRRVEIVQYDPPNMDMLGAKFYFPRTLPDGKPIIAAKDKELRFETQIGDRKIKAKFDLRKMIYGGKLEI